jgi:hypothetical protein
MNWRSALLALTIFACGGAAGWAVSWKVARDKVEVAKVKADMSRIITGPGLPQEERILTTFRNLRGDLNLTADQSAQVEKTVTHWREENKRFRELTRRLIPRILRELEPTLTPQQRSQLEGFRKRMQSQWKNPAKKDREPREPREPKEGVEKPVPAP